MAGTTQEPREKMAREQDSNLSLQENEHMRQCWDTGVPTASSAPLSHEGCETLSTWASLKTIKKKKRFHSFLKNALPNFSHGARTSHYKMVSVTYAWFVCWISIHQGLPFLPNHPAKCNYICLVYNSFATVSAGAVRTWEGTRPSRAVSFLKYKGKFSKILCLI